MDQDHGSKSKAHLGCGHYDAIYGNFQERLYEQIRLEAFGEDIGQNSWLTSSEHDRFQSLLDLAPGKKLLDVACGAGGPALRIASKTGCSVVGIDFHEQAISTARALAAKRGLAGIAEFRVEDAARQLPFADASFDAITCVDAINHLPHRHGVIADWARLLRAGGRLLFTDPVTLTGPLTNAEIAIRGSIGFFLFVPPGFDKQVITECGLRLLVCEDVTANMAEIAERRRTARESRSSALREIEGEDTYEGQQSFFEVTARVARERRLSRFLYVAEKPA